MLSVNVATKDDQIDKALCKYMNDAQDIELKQFKILFMRECEGVYQYGSQRVSMKLDKKGEVKVKTGGGYLSVEEFINNNQEVERQKVVRRDVTNRFRQKLAMQRLIQDRASTRIESIPLEMSQVPKPTSNYRKGFSKTQTVSHYKQRPKSALLNYEKNDNKAYTQTFGKQTNY